MKIQEILARRSDLSTFLVHLTRDTKDSTAKEKLSRILSDQRLTALSPFGPAASRFEKRGISTDSQRCVCFTETPLEHCSLLIGDIDDRQIALQPYGVAISKMQGRKAGANPIWYVDITPGHYFLGTNALEPLIDRAIAQGDVDNLIFKLAPFVEQMGSGTSASTGEPYRKEFWWEREWRINGDLPLPPRLIVLCPAQDIAYFRDLVASLPGDIPKWFEPRFIDPRWSLERIIAFLAGFKGEDLGPF